jgi:hypothetical protein
MCFFKLSQYKAHQKQKRGALIKVAGMYVCIYVCMYVCVCVCVYMCVCVCVCVCTHTHTCTHLYTHSHTQTGHVIQHDENTVRIFWRRWQVQFLNLKFMYTNFCLNFKEAEPAIYSFQIKEAEIHFV